MAKSGLLERIALLRRRTPDDDAALRQERSGGVLVSTTDVLVEGVNSVMPPSIEVSLAPAAANLSDLRDGLPGVNGPPSAWVAPPAHSVELGGGVYGLGPWPIESLWRRFCWARIAAARSQRLC